MTQLDDAGFMGANTGADILESFSADFAQAKSLLTTWPERVVDCVARRPLVSLWGKTGFMLVPYDVGSRHVQNLRR